jgi:hypothetical protein
MDSLDLQVLSQAHDWVAQGHAVWLLTVLETWGSAPRPPGALRAARRRAGGRLGVRPLRIQPRMSSGTDQARRFVRAPAAAVAPAPRDRQP